MKIILSLSAASPLAKGQNVIVKYGKDEWFAGVVTTVSRTGGYTVTFNEGTVIKFLDGKKLKPISKKGKKTPYSDEEARSLIAIKLVVKEPAPKDQVKPPSEPPKGNKLEKRLKSLNISDSTLIKTLSSMPYILAISSGVSTNKNHAGFWPFTYMTRNVTFLNGVTVPKMEVFEIMKRVGGGLKGKPSKVFNCTKGCAQSRVDGSLLGSCDVSIEGFIVPEKWVEHYTKEHKIPLNLYTTVITGSEQSVTATYIAKIPVASKPIPKTPKARTRKEEVIIPKVKAVKFVQ